MDLIRTHSLTQLEQDTAKGNSAFHERLKTVSYTHLDVYKRQALMFSHVIGRRL